MEYKEPFKEDSLNLRIIALKCLNYWYLFILAPIICIAIAFYNNKFKPNIYEVQTSILVRKNKLPSDISSINLENLLNTNNLDLQMLNTEIGVLKSYHTIGKTLDKLNFELSILEEGSFYNKDLFNQSPFDVYYDTSHLQPLNTKIYIIPIDDKSYKLNITKENTLLYNYRDKKAYNDSKTIQIDTTVNYKDTIINNFIKLCICKNTVYNKEVYNKKYFIVFNTKSSLIEKYMSVNAAAREESQIIDITYHTQNQERGIHFLQSLLETYLERSVSKKKEIANRTIEFISGQVDEISDSLQKAEIKLENYRSTEKIMNLDILTKNAYNNLQQLQEQKANMLLELKYYDYLRKYLKSNDKGINELLAPSSMGIDDTYLKNLIDKFSQLASEKSELEVNTKKDNPYLEGLRHKIDELKQALIENLNNLENQNEIQLKDINKRIASISGSIKQLPVKQRLLFNLERKFELYNELYKLLLKKQSEIKISKASTLPIHEILDPPRLSSPSPIAPKKQQSYLLAIFIGLLIPGAYVFGKDWITGKFTAYDNIENITDIPVIGHIFNKKSKHENVVYNNQKSLIAESFRSVRTNFQFIAKKGEVTKLLVTSANQGEGKSFVTINLATTFARYNKKTIIVSFDLRKKNLYQLDHLEDKNGISTYLSGNCAVENIIHATGVPNLDIIITGIIPHNPLELIASEKTKELVDYLEKEYHYIIFDTPPLGVITDSLLLVKHTDLQLIIVRQDYTKKRLLNIMLQNLKQINIENNYIVINDVKRKKGYGYQYGYYYYR